MSVALLPVVISFFHRRGTQDRDSLPEPDFHSKGLSGSPRIQQLILLCVCPQTDVLLCTTVPIPSGDQFIGTFCFSLASFLVTGSFYGTAVGIRGKPIPGVHHHLMVILCDEPGYRVLDAGRQENENPVWECGYQNLAERTSLLPNARECSGSGDSFFNYQFQGGSEEEGSLVLPPGTGVQLGSGFNSIIGMFHFFRTDELVNGSTAGAEIEITFRRSSNTSHINQVRSLLLMANGFVGAKSVSSVAGSWTLEEETEMHILQLYTHWHELNGMAIEIQVWVERQDRKRDILLRKDPKSSSGISDVSNSPAAVMRRGDRLVVRCTFNNTESHNLRVE